MPLPANSAFFPEHTREAGWPFTPGDLIADEKGGFWRYLRLAGNHEERDWAMMSKSYKAEPSHTINVVYEDMWPLRLKDEEPQTLLLKDVRLIASAEGATLLLLAQHHATSLMAMMEDIENAAGDASEKAKKIVSRQTG